MNLEGGRDYNGVFLKKTFEAGAVSIADGAVLQQRIQKKMQALSGDDLTRFNQSLKRANEELKLALEQGDVNASKNYQVTILELCK